MIKSFRIFFYLLLGLLGFWFGTFLGEKFAKGEESISIYDSPTWKDKVVLEVCFKDKPCDKLVLPKDQLNSPAVDRWFDAIHEESLRGK